MTLSHAWEKTVTAKHEGEHVKIIVVYNTCYMPDAIPIFKSDEVTLQDALQQTQHGFQGQNFWSCQLYRYDAFRTQIERWLNVMNIFHEITFMGDIRKMQTARKLYISVQ